MDRCDFPLELPDDDATEPLVDGLLSKPSEPSSSTASSTCGCCQAAGGGPVDEPNLKK